MNDRYLVAVLLPLVRKFIWAVDGQMWDLGTFPQSHGIGIGKNPVRGCMLGVVRVKLHEILTDVRQDGMLVGTTVWKRVLRQVEVHMCWASICCKGRAAFMGHSG